MALGAERHDLRGGGEPGASDRRLREMGRGRRQVMSPRAMAPLAADAVVAALGTAAGHTGGLEDRKLARRGRLFTFTNDHMFESPDPPVTHAVVDLDGGGRIYLQLTDCDADRVEIDMPLDLTFRKLHEGGGFHNYFWKARPA